MTTLNKVLSLMFLTVVACFSQVTTTQTTLSAALAASSASGASGPTTVCVASSTGIAAPGFGNPALTGLMVDTEFMIVNAATPSSTCWSVTRGFAGTRVTAHASGAVVWVGPTGGSGGSPFINVPPVPNTPCVVAGSLYTPMILVGSESYQAKIGNVYSCPASLLWLEVDAAGGNPMTFYIAPDGGANNAITASVPGLTQAASHCVSVKLAHTLQAGANTFALNGATAVAIKSHFADVTNIATAYAATGTWNGCYDGTAWLDISE